MSFITFILTTITTLIIIFSLVGMLLLKSTYFKLIKSNWPSLTNSQHLIRHQRIFNYRMKSNVKNIYQYYETMIIYSIMFITLGVSIGGYLIGNLNLTLAPMAIISIELTMFFFINRHFTSDVNEYYKQYIRTHLDNEMKVVTIPNQIVKGLNICRIILSIAFFIESVLIIFIILLLNHVF